MKNEHPKFRVGQVVLLLPCCKDRNHKGERYQRITKVWDWTFDEKTPTGVTSCTNGFGYSFLNGDQCHEKYLAELTTREQGKSKKRV